MKISVTFHWNVYIMKYRRINLGFHIDWIRSTVVAQFGSVYGNISIFLLGWAAVSHCESNKTIFV